MSDAPNKIIVPRIRSAPRIPQNSTRCWYSGGTRMYWKIIAITKTLSADNDSSITYPVKNFTAARRPSLITPSSLSTCVPSPSQWFSYSA